MRTILQTAFISALLNFLSGLIIAQPPRIGGYNVYYGNLHNHCEYSDGKGKVSDAYYTAKNIAGFDFFGLTDHAEMLTFSEWNSIKNTSDAFNEDGVFTALWGFEWSSVTDGHLLVIGSENYASSLSILTNTFGKLNKWLNDHECVAFLNHPGDFDALNNEFLHFNTTVSDKVAGMELWNGNTGFERYYYNNGYNLNDGGLGFYDEALKRNWKTGAAGAEDNHSATWGAVQYRLAILANGLTRDSMMSAMHKRRFYSTLDRNIEMSFTINNSEMGSTLDPGSYTGEILLHDADDEVFTEIEVIYNGALYETFSVSSREPEITFPVNAGKLSYFYIIATQEDGDKAISSPIFFNNNDFTGLFEESDHGSDIIIEYTGSGIPGIKLQEYHSDLTLAITDIYGRVICSLPCKAGTITFLPADNFSKGIYIIYFVQHPELGSYKVSMGL